MNIITRKALLLAAPVPPTPRETRILIRLEDPASLVWGMSGITLAEGCARTVINWGDGTTTELTATGEVAHAYDRTGEYEVRLSDDIGALKCSKRTGTSPYCAIYAPMIRKFRTNAAVLDALSPDCFYNAVNFSSFTCEGSALRTLGSLSFRGCEALVGRLDLPLVEDISATAFNGSLGVTELHFSAAKEAAITALSGFATKFGAANAAISFDL